MALTNLDYANLPKNALIVIEEALGDNKRIFARMLGAEAVKAGEEAVIVTPQAREDVISQMSRLGVSGDTGLKIIDRFRDRSRLRESFGGDLYIIDGFSLLFSDASPEELYNALAELTDLSRTSERVVVLTSDTGLLPTRSEKMLRAMADGVIQFEVVYEEDRISRYIKIPKLAGMAPQEKMLSFTVDKGRIYIDTRERFG